MNTKKGFRLFLCVLSIAHLGGCARNISSNTYKASHIGEASLTYPGIILSARKVNVEEGEYLEQNRTGIGLGALGGGAIGNQMGHGRGRTAATIGGALLGGLGGAFAEKSLKGQDAFEYVVKLDNGSTMSVVQGLDSPLQAGQRVYVQVSKKGRSRVIPA